MTRREQITKILEETLGYDGDYCEKGAFKTVTDKILALPPKEPEQNQILEWAGYCAGNTTNNHDQRIVLQAALVLGAKWGIEEIKRLNQWA